MQPINGPLLKEAYPDREQHCREAIERTFQDVADAAVKAGWSREETAAVLVILADCNLVATSRSAAGSMKLRGTTH